MGPFATMKIKVPALALLLLAILLSIEGIRAQKLGPNCNGSALCAIPSKDTLASINAEVQTLPNASLFFNDELIKCVNNVCAFLQNVPAPGFKTGAQIKLYVQSLLNFGCQVCGNYPTQSDDNTADGELTVNYITRT